MDLKSIVSGVVGGVVVAGVMLAVGSGPPAPVEVLAEYQPTPVPNNYHVSGQAIVPNNDHPSNMHQTPYGWVPNGYHAAWVPPQNIGTPPNSPQPYVPGPYYHPYAPYPVASHWPYVVHHVHYHYHYPMPEAGPRTEPKPE